MSSEGWPEVRLADHVDLLTGFPFKSAEFTDNPHDVPLVRGDNVIQRRFRWDGVRRWPRGDVDAYSGYLLESGDVILAMDRPWIEAGLKYAVVSSQDLPCLLVQRVSRMRGINGLSTRFLRYVIGSPAFTDHILAVQTGTAVPHISGRQIGDFRFALPPVPQQERIADVLGAIDDKIELNRRINRTLESMARATFKSWFVDFDPVCRKMEGSETGLPPDLAALFPSSLSSSDFGAIPEGWDVGTLGDLSHKPQYGYTASSKSEPVGPKFLRITDINKTAWIDWESVPHCEIEDEDREKYRLHKGDVLIARMADPGHGVMIEANREAVFASYLIRFRPKNVEYARFLQYWLHSRSYWDLVEGRGAGTTRVSLNAQVLRSFPLVIPPRSVAGAFDEAVGRLRDCVVARASEIQVLAATRDALLPKLLSGELGLGRVRVTGRIPEEAIREARSAWPTRQVPRRTCPGR